MKELYSAQRIVIKVGSYLVIDDEDGRAKHSWLTTLAEDIEALRAQGKEVILVSSGAVALGRGRLGLPKGRLKLEEKQAAAAAGQIALMEAWQRAFDLKGITVAQMLLTIEDSEDRRRYLNARATLETLLELGAVPIVNENDTVATSEIRVGDNDRLGARVAQMSSADLLILLSDVDGIYTEDPRINPLAEHISIVHEITDEIIDVASPAKSSTGTGGMITKVQAAEIATTAGCHTAIALGLVEHPINELLLGKRHTVFTAQTSPRTARKEWLAGSLSALGAFVIDAGAAKALYKGNSLLPAGVVGVEGDFQRADPVEIKTIDGDILAKGLTAYGSADAIRIMGHQTADIAEILGYKGRDALIHRDDMVMMG